MEKQLIYIGTYSQRGSEGIYNGEVDADGAVTLREATSATNPTFVSVTPDKRFVVAALEVGTWEGAAGGAVCTYAVGKDGRLEPVGARNVRGIAPCHVTTDPTGQWIVCANYGDGSHTVLPLAPDGRIGIATDFVTNKGAAHPGQTSAHAHCSLFSPDGRFLYTCDLGLDRVSVYSFDAKAGEMAPRSFVDLVTGSGPRHFVFHPRLSVAYAINELNSTITVFERNGSTGELKITQTVPTVPEGYAAENYCADVHVSPDGHFLYGSNRGLDSLAVFAVEEGSGHLKPLAQVPTGGKHPRNFALLQGSDLMLVANRDSDNVVAFRVGKDGIPSPTGAVTTIPAPVCIAPYSGSFL